MHIGVLLLVVALGASACSRPDPSFEKHTLDSAYRAEGVAVFDVDRDGHPDIVTDEYWYAGPTFSPHEIRTPETFDPATQFGHAFAIRPIDLDGDGWLDIVVAPHPGDAMFWYRNPRGADVHWDRFTIAGAGVAGLETPLLVDLFRSGRPALLMSDSTTGTLGWFEPPPDPTQPWILHPISAAGFAGGGLFQHGIGIGDLDGDGRTDVLTGYAWFQQVDGPAFVEHDVAFGPNRCSRLQVLDADGDGRADVFCAAPHDYGFAWWKQEGDGSFAPHAIDDTLSQMHALEAADLDGDGIPELVSGKRFWAQGPTHDPGSGDPAVLALYRLRRDSGSVSIQRIDIDRDSGIGASLAIEDVDGDGKKDIVVSNKKGLFWFRSR
jgi:hypothetical protein